MPETNPQLELKFIRKEKQRLERVKRKIKNKRKKMYKSGKITNANKQLFKQSIAVCDKKLELLKKNKNRLLCLQFEVQIINNWIRNKKKIQKQAKHSNSILEAGDKIRVDDFNRNIQLAKERLYRQLS